MNALPVLPVSVLSREWTGGDNHPPGLDLHLSNGMVLAISVDPDNECLELTAYRTDVFGPGLEVFAWQTGITGDALDDAVTEVRKAVRGWCQQQDEESGFGEDDNDRSYDAWVDRQIDNGRWS